MARRSPTAATYTSTIITSNGVPQIQLLQQCENVYFAGRLLSEEGNLVATDRLASVRSGGPGGLGYQAQYPYGVEYTTTANDREKYATYTRDSVTGLDYAMNRSYSSQWGRFLSPDPYNGGASLRNPQSWNRYAYTMGDPINFGDSRGLMHLSKDGGGGDDGDDGIDQNPCQSDGFDDCGQGFGGQEAGGGGAPGLLGGGGGGPVSWAPPAHIASHNSQAIISEFQRGFQQAWAVLNTNPGCAGALMGQPAESNVAAYDTGILADTTYWIEPFPAGSTAGASTAEPTPVPGNTDSVPSTTVLINQNGAFFAQPSPNGSVIYQVPSPTTGNWVAVILPQVDFQAFILLHEFGHQTGVFGADQNPIVNGQHSWDVLQNCFGLQAP
jgi:RHS repeat-associated protein